MTYGEMTVQMSNAINDASRHPFQGTSGVFQFWGESGIMSGSPFHKLTITLSSPFLTGSK